MEDGKDASVPGTAKSGRVFRVARNPNPASRLGYVVSLPVAAEGALVLACAAPWPGPKDVYCHPLPEWPDGAEVIEEVPVQACRRSGSAVQLVLRRRQRKRSMFVFTEQKGRPAVFWRTESTMRAARPGVRVPAARGLDGPLDIAVDIRERYPWRFAAAPVRLAPRELPVGDYGVFVEDRLVGVIERKSAPDLAAAATSGKLALTLADLESVPLSALVIESRLSDVLKRERPRPAWMMNLIAGLQAAHPRVPWLFAETRALAEDLAWRWLAAARKAAMIEAAGRAAGRVAASSPSYAAVQLPLEVRDRQHRMDEACRMAADGRTWTSAAYAAHFGVGVRTAWSDLRALVEAGALRAEGSRRNRRYVPPSAAAGEEPRLSGS